MDPSKKTHPIPDGLDAQVPEELHPALQFLLDNIKPIGVGILTVVVVVAAITGYQNYQKKQLIEASQKLGKIVQSSQGDERIKALQSFIAEAPEAVLPSALFSLADEAMQAGQYAVAADAYKRLAGLSDDSTALVAILGQASAEMAGGNPGEAADLLSQLKAKAPENFVIMINMQLAQAYEQAGQYQAAIDAYQDVLNKTGQESRSLFEYKISKLKAKLELGNASSS